MADKKETKAVPAEKKESRPERKESRQPNAIARYYRETIGELRKVSWPTRQEATNMTLIVIVVLVIMTIFLGSVDAFGAFLLRLITGV